MDATSRYPERLTISPPRPLHLRKKSKAYLDPAQEGIRPPHEAYSSTSRSSPQTSFQRSNIDPDKSYPVYNSDSESNQITPVEGKLPHPTLADSVRLYLTSPSVESPSTVSDIQSTYLSDSSSPILGDFIPFEKSKMESSSGSRNGLGLSESPAKAVQITRRGQKTNPYQFELDTPDMDEEERQATRANFMRKHDSSPTPFPTPRMAHFKNAHSAGSAIDMENLSPLANMSQGPSRLRMQRSGSSPNIGAMRFAPREGGQDSPELPSFAQEYGFRTSPTRGRRLAETTTNRGRQYVDDYGSPPRRASPVQSRRDVYESSTALQVHVADYYRQDSTPTRSLYDRHVTRSPPKASDLLYARNSNNVSNSFRNPAKKPRYPIETSIPAPKSLPKRSRSPMKKLFGEKGWFGETSPNDVNLKPERVRPAPSRINTEFSDAGKKAGGIMGRLKNKLGEFAEKADMTPKNSPSSHEKSAKLNMLAISLGPPEQARISMEVELMLVHTANCFLMAQFSAGRMSVDSIKKTVDTWKSKGRPAVIEFMYDQVTQRDLVSINQYEFRFFGERAGDNIRINSMLYNWKQVANLMAVRTFCNADTVILKLLFDIEQILEFLGAGEAIMLRVQQIRARVMELMRVARLSLSKDGMAQSTGNQQQRNVSGRQEPLYDTCSSAQRNGRDGIPHDSRTSASASRNGREEELHNFRPSGHESRATAESFDDPYGGLKLVPDQYREC